MTAKITALGFERATIQDIKADIDADIKALEPNYSPSVDVPESIFGQLSTFGAILADKLISLAQAVYETRNIVTAEGVPLEDLLLYNNIRKLAASYTIIKDYKIVGKQGLVIPAGFTVASKLEPNLKFVNDTEITIPGTDPSQFSEVLVTLRCTKKGKFIIPANTCTTVETFVFGIQSVAHPDCLPGRNEETDTEVKIRRLSVLSSTVSGTAEGIKKAVFTLNNDPTKVNIDYVDCIENDTGNIDSSGRPSGCVELIVRQAGNSTSRDLEIAQALYNAKGTGTQAYGDNGPFNVLDAAGRTRQVYFTRPTAVPMYFKAVISAEVPFSNIAAFRLSLIQKITTWGNTLGVGKNVLTLGGNSLSIQLDDSKIVNISDLAVSVDGLNWVSSITISSGLVTPPQFSYWSVADVYTSLFIVQSTL